MSIGNGLALIFFGDPAVGYAKTKGGATRGQKGLQAAPTGLPIDEDVAKFEIFLEHCEFILHSSSAKTIVELQRLDCCAQGPRPDATGLLPKVKPHDWKTILSRYRFNVATRDSFSLKNSVGSIGIHQNLHNGFTTWRRCFKLPQTSH
jgi:hypothetical protein